MSDARPTAGRLRRPTWRDPRLLIGIALIALSVVAVAGMVRAADSTRPVYAAKDTLAPGTVIAEDDVVVAHVKVSGDAYLDAKEALPVGQVVTRTVGAGELLPSAALVAESDSVVRPIAVAPDLPLDDGIGPGAMVDVWMTTLDDAGDATTVLIGEGLVVTAVDEADGSFAVAGDQVVHVGVPRDDVAAFLQALAAGGDLSVVGLGGQP